METLLSYLPLIDFKFFISWEVIKFLTNGATLLRVFSNIASKSSLVFAYCNKAIQALVQVFCDTSTAAVGLFATISLAMVKADMAPEFKNTILIDF